ncbi:MAG: glycosyltransferase family 4 protein [Pseudomonadota bacterium]|nr:glycosyltransferase family 4 protein [Pseudomonadota bacterium]
MNSDPGARHRRYKFGIVLSTSLGNLTRYQNFRRYAEQDPEVELTWAPISHYFEPGVANPYERLPRAVQARAIVIHQAQPVLRKLDELDALLIHMYEVDLLLALRAKFLRTPLRIVSTDDGPAIDPATYPFHPVDGRKAAWRKRLRLRVDLWRSRSADFLIPFSTWAADLHIRGAGKSPDRVEPIHVGLDLRIWPDRDRSNVVAHDRIKLLFVGGEFERKGGALLLQVFKSHFQDVAELHLVSKSAPKDLPANTTLYDDYHANDPRLAELYRAADIFVLPTLSDLSSWVTLEAMASGCPVVVTPVGGISDLVDPEVTGILIPVGDADALRKAIERLIDDPARRIEMGQAARRYVETRFDAAKNVPRILGIMKRLVDADRLRPARTPASAKIANRTYT